MAYLLEVLPLVSLILLIRFLVLAQVFPLLPVQGVSLPLFLLDLVVLVALVVLVVFLLFLRLVVPLLACLCAFLLVSLLLPIRFLLKKVFPRFQQVAWILVVYPLLQVLP